MTSSELLDIIGIFIQYPIYAAILYYIFKLWARFESLEKRAFFSQMDSEMLFKGMRGCLKSLARLPQSNGETDEALKDLEDYINKKAAGTLLKKDDR